MVVREEIIKKEGSKVTPKIFMIAGPNGAGKTTTAMSFVTKQTIDEYINVDEIAKGLAPLHPASVSLAASKLLIKRLKELLDEKKSFAFETTGAGSNYVKHLKHAQTRGYEIHLLYLWLPSSDLAVERVANRVKQGGHDIPEETIRRRYVAGIKNLIKHYLPLADSALIFDNSVTRPDRIIADKCVGGNLVILEPNTWKEIQEVAHAKKP